jgi:CHAT domain-containing protein
VRFAGFGPAASADLSTSSCTKKLWPGMVELMRTPQYRHPYYWAGFVMIGNGY